MADGVEWLGYVEAVKEVDQILAHEFETVGVRIGGS